MTSTTLTLRSCARTHVGRRSNNEDACCAREDIGVFAVADGMGGYDGGEVASRLVIEALTHFFTRVADDADATWPFAFDPRFDLDENMVSVAVRLAHERVCAAKEHSGSRMGSTVVALALRGGRAIIGHVGDSRVYRLREGQLLALTEDHSLYAEMLRQGVSDLPPRERCPFSNVITRGIGMQDAADPEVRSEDARVGDVYLLCSDGLIETLPDERLAELLALNPIERACERLVGEAYSRGGKDNITAVIVEVVGKTGDRVAGTSAPLASVEQSRSPKQ